MTIVFSPSSLPKRFQRHPLTKEERAEAEKLLAVGVGARGGTENIPPQALPAGGGGDVGEDESRGKGEQLIEPANFFKDLDAWVDSKYPGDRSSATKVKVAFRKVRFRRKF